MDAETRKFIRDEIRLALAPIILGNIISNESSLRSTVQRTASDSGMENVRNILPYGISSRAPAKTTALIVPMAGDTTHPLLVGHFDETRPELNDGESAVYDAHGHVVFLSSSKMQFGSKNSANPMMLGDLVQQLLSDLIEKIATHQHLGNLGYATGTPINQAEFEALKASPVDDGSLVSTKAFTE